VLFFLKADNKTFRSREFRRCRQSNGLGMQPAKGAGQQAGNKRVQELGLGGKVGLGVGQKGRGSMRARESTKPKLFAREPAEGDVRVPV
jgi:hypothetical protein